MRIANARDLGLYVRERRRLLDLTQADLAKSARVSRRWLSDLESGKPTAEVGLIFRILHALGVFLDVKLDELPEGSIDLDVILRNYGTGSG